jgi:hypothetical protein
MRSPPLIQRDSIPQENDDADLPLSEHERSRQRLNRISHHFLSEPSSPGKEKRQVIHDVFVLHRQPQLPLISIGEIIARRGWRVEICYPNGSTSVVTTNYDGQSMSQSRPMSLRFHSIHDYELLNIDERSTVLIGMPERHDSLRETYSLLKNYQNRLKNSLLGITIVDSQDRMHAEQWFHAIEVAAKRYLDIDLVSYGAIYQGGDNADSFDGTQCLATLIIQDMALKESEQDHWEKLC